ncbi:MAG: hypothetical protein ACK4NF_07450 [Planctomycetota bacterium]
MKLKAIWHTSSTNEEQLSQKILPMGWCVGCICRRGNIYIIFSKSIII